MATVHFAIRWTWSWPPSRSQRDLSPRPVMYQEMNSSVSTSSLHGATNGYRRLLVGERSPSGRTHWSGNE